MTEDQLRVQYAAIGYGHRVYLPKSGDVGYKYITVVDGFAHPATQWPNGKDMTGIYPTPTGYMKKRPPFQAASLVLSDRLTFNGQATGPKV